MQTAVVSALGVTILLGTPLLAQADQGKWWTPKEGDRRIEKRERGGGWNDQGTRGDRGTTDRRAWGDRSGNGRVTYRDRGWSARGSWGTYRSWRGVPVRRDVIVIRDRRHGSYFRARRVFVQPRFYRGSLYVRPVRYFIAADACIGGINIHARIVRPHYLYGCNFCDARFDTYDAYAAHVAHCDHGPDEYTIQASNWDDNYDSDWDGPYQADDEDDHGYDE
ncbi:MAG TPA: hypothetical protein VGK76_11420 [Candidatus Eisenbacteria bacterium]